jgi:nucleoside phosphorylase/CheY-like chemotaxis protein
MLSVLILEDNQRKLSDVVNVLIGTGLVDHSSIDTANDAFTARKLLAKKYYDILILDIVVPERLGEAPSENSGCMLLQDINLESTLNMPGRVIGLTEFTDLAQKFVNDFQTGGVVLISYNESSDSWHKPVVVQLKQHINWQAAKTNGEREFQTYLGIVCALDVEFDAIQKLPWSFADEKIGGDPTMYIKGSVNCNGTLKTVVAALCPRMGMSAASITSMKLIEAFRPEIIAMTGITGAVRGHANLGDLIVADECWDWGMGKWGRKEGKQVFMPGPHHLSLDADLRNAAARLSRNTKLLASIRDDFNGDKPDTVLRLLVGPVASGSAVIASQEMTENIQAQHRKLIGIEMESYGVYSAAAEATFPRPKAISIKAASDFADDQKDDSYRYYCSFVSAMALYHLVLQGLQ